MRTALLPSPCLSFSFLGPETRVRERVRGRSSVLVDVDADATRAGFWRKKFSDAGHALGREML